MPELQDLKFNHMLNCGRVRENLRAMHEILEHLQSTLKKLRKNMDD